MEEPSENRVEYLVVDTSAFIKNAPLQEIGKKIITTKSVVNEITNTRQLRRLCVLPYDLVIKDVFSENLQVVTEFAKKTGDYPSLSSTDLQIIALTYQLEKEHVGLDHINKEPTTPAAAVATNVVTKKATEELIADTVGFYVPGKSKPIIADDKAHNGELLETDNIVNESQENSKCESNAIETEKQDEVGNNSTSATDLNELDALNEKFGKLDVTEETCKALLGDLDIEADDVLVAVNNDEDDDDDDDDSYESYTSEEGEDDDENEDEDEDDEDSWITPMNVKHAKIQASINGNVEEKHAIVACMTTDFSMQNVLKQMNLNVATLDGMMIRQLRTFILRCHACFSTTSIMTKKFCPKCGNNTLKRVGVSLDTEGKQIIHINGRKPLTGRGKRFSMPTIKGGRHANNPIVAEDQPTPHQHASRLARMKNNPMDEDYIAGYSPFIMRDVNSRSSKYGVRPDGEVKYWMRQNPNEARRTRKKR